MEAENKARELYLKMLSWEYDSNKYIENNIISSSSKQCALIAVDEILKANKVWYKDTIPYKYWSDVKHEIEKL